MILMRSMQRHLHAGARQEHLQVHLGNVLEELDEDVLGVDITRQTAAGPQPEDNHQPLEDGQLHLGEPIELFPTPAALGAQHFTAAVDFEPVEAIEIDFQAQSMIADGGQSPVQVGRIGGGNWPVPAAR